MSSGAVSKDWCIVCRSDQTVEAIVRVCREDPTLKTLYAYEATSSQGDKDLKVIYATFREAKHGEAVRSWIWRHDLNDIDHYPKQHPMFVKGTYKFTRIVKSFLRKGQRVTMTPPPPPTAVGGVDDVVESDHSPGL